MSKYRVIQLPPSINGTVWFQMQKFLPVNGIWMHVDGSTTASIEEMELKIAMMGRFGEGIKVIREFEGA